MRPKLKKIKFSKILTNIYVFPPSERFFGSSLGKGHHLKKMRRYNCINFCSWSNPLNLLKFAPNILGTGLDFYFGLSTVTTVSNLFRSKYNLFIHLYLLVIVCVYVCIYLDLLVFSCDYLYSGII